MATPFLSSEEYDERAHKLYDEGDYETALETLKEGLRLYPHSVELYVGVGYTRLAREEYAWARQSFERALVLDPEHEDGLVGMGEVLLRFGQREDAMHFFGRAKEAGCAEDLDLLMSMGRALYREQMYAEARDVFGEAVALHGESADAAAALGYTLHRLGEETAARRQLRRALHLDGGHHEARVYLGHLMYDRGDWAGALREFECVPASDHWDSLALCRLIELKRALADDEEEADVEEWERRLEEIESDDDSVNRLLAELEAEFSADAPPILVESEGLDEAHRVQLPEGPVVSGTWLQIVSQIRDVRGVPEETVAQFMRRRAEEVHAHAGVYLPAEDPEQFVLAGARAGLWQIEY